LGLIEQRSRLAPALRTQDVKPFRVMTVLERARELEAQGKSVIHLEVGEPDFVTAGPIVEAGREALAQGETAYSPAAGLPQLREKIAKHYWDAHGVRVSEQRILVTPGASGALSLVAQMMLNPGDGVLMSDPGYPCNRHFVRLAGAQAQLIPVTAQTNFQINLALVERYSKENTKALWLASPANPSGTMISQECMAQLSQWSEQNNAHVVVDEIYHGLSYEQPAQTALNISDDIIVVNSFSKYFGMTGWRLGWLVVPESLVAVSNILAQNLFIAASTIAQHAALRAFDNNTRVILEQRRGEFMRRRDFLTGVLRELGFSVPVETQGAFYIYAGIEKFSQDSEQFCARLLEEFGVAITPGTDFGDFKSQQYVRFAFTTGMDQLQDAAQRLRTAVASGRLSS
jgi:aspartate/methionine/tyrosine aminotransferase